MLRARRCDMSAPKTISAMIKVSSKTETMANLLLSASLTEAGYAVTYEESRRRFCGRSMKSVQEEIEAGGVDRILPLNRRKNLPVR